MNGFNRSIVAGNITRDIELRYTPSGMAVVDLVLAVNEKRKGKNGEVIEDVVFIDVTCWGRTAEIAGEYLGKGSPVLIEGRLKQESWEDKNGGGKRTKLKIVADKLLMLGSKGDGQQGGQQGGNAGQRQGRQQPRGDEYTSYDAAPDDNPAGWQNGSPPADEIPF